MERFQCRLGASFLPTQMPSEAQTRNCLQTIVLVGSSSNGFESVANDEDHWSAMGSIDNNALLIPARILRVRVIEEESTVITNKVGRLTIAANLPVIGHRPTTMGSKVAAILRHRMVWIGHVAR
ncbi:uncharacterized protein LOC105698260 [Orussus abietinus]|uniref:uncharacterized protein LOC105698260 n=1 Tax=Orussus abietinus TaxID=222816 RepID=UPI000626D7F7|nr:uncharacterized protein LOC105698260 [Orussus abietinus]